MPTITQTVTVQGNRSNIGQPQSWWNDTGIVVNAGEALTITAKDPDDLIIWSGRSGFGPAGDVDNIPSRDWPETLANRTGIEPGDTNCWFGSLIGKIGRNGLAFSIGLSRALTPTTSGTLFLAYNDGANFQDNDGSWEVTVSIIRPATPPIPPDSEALYEMWSNSMVNSVKETDTRSCLSFIVNREVVGNSPANFLGSGVFAQAQVITWVVLNNLALTKELDAGKRHGNNQSVVYCRPSDVSPCAGSARYTSPNDEVERGINHALNNYRYRSSNDPTSGSLQWRHIPNEGWPEYNQNQIMRIEGESIATFFNRNQEAANRFKVQNPRRIYFDAQVKSVEEAERYQYLSMLRALAVFPEGSDTEGANLYDVLKRPQAGNLQPPRDSCQRN